MAWDRDGRRRFLSHFFIKGVYDHMADRQQQYRGKKSGIPRLLEGELGYCTDTRELYIGTGNGNVLVGSGDFADTLSGKLTAVPAESVSAVSETAELANVIACVNSLISGLKAAGIMKES